MISTPICDFVSRYAESSVLRLHMPGHKGVNLLGWESRDLTEIEGADSLYEASGIIRESEENAGKLFGAPTFYSTEGSSQCIRAMLYLVMLHAKGKGKSPVIWAGRNAHKTFLSAAALLDLDVEWLYPEDADSYLSCRIEAGTLEKLLAKAQEMPAAVYLTSPDYLGNTVDIASLAEVCHRHGVLLVVDNAHGAYLKFLSPSRHPMDLGADLCCDSAHKTLPVLTGGAYLHISPDASPLFASQAKNALALFGSTSPSYLILQSLDRCNRYLAEGYPERLNNFLRQAAEVKARLTAHGYLLQGDEPLKLTISAKPYGYTGTELAQLLLKQEIVSEFADPDFVVFMVTPETGSEGLGRLETALCSLPAKPAVTEPPPVFCVPQRQMSVREAALSPSQTLPVSECVGKVLAAATVGCPPAVPIVMCGEQITDEHIACFSYYGIENCTVVKESTPLMPDRL